MERGNLTETEAFRAWRAGSEGKAPPPRPRLYENPFDDARRSVSVVVGGRTSNDNDAFACIQVWHLAKCYEQGIYSCVLQDVDEQEAICIRVSFYGHVHISSFTS